VISRVTLVPPRDCSSPDSTACPTRTSPTRLAHKLTHRIRARVTVHSSRSTVHTLFNTLAMLVSGRRSISGVQYTGDEASAEIKKLLDAVVSVFAHFFGERHRLTSFRLRARTSSKSGSRWLRAPLTSKAVLRATPARRLLSSFATFTTASSRNTRCSSVIGRSMPTSSSPSAAPRLRRWCVSLPLLPSTCTDCLCRFMSAVSRAYRARWTFGRTTAHSRWTLAMTTMLHESKSCYLSASWTQSHT
jgi:hypothetical protein